MSEHENSSSFDDDTAGEGNGSTAGANQQEQKTNGKDHTAGNSAPGPETEAAAAIVGELTSIRAGWGADGVRDLLDLVRSDEVAFEKKRKPFSKQYGLSLGALNTIREKYQSALAQAQKNTADAKKKKAEATAAGAAIPPVEARHFLDLTPEERAAELKRTERAAARLLLCPDLLAEVAKTLQALGLAGDPSPGELTYLCLASRVLKKPASAALRGSSAAGKSYTAGLALKMHPPASRYELNSTSPKALIYEEERFEHRIVFMFEASKLQAAKDEDEMAMLLRVLISENTIRYKTVLPGDHGKLSRTIKVDKDGPVVFLTTTTGDLPPEVETRLLSIFIPESEAQTRAVLGAIADDENRVPPDLTEWHALGRWLELIADNGVATPFSKVLARLTRSTGDQRIHRDFGAMLALVRVHALLRAKFRQRDARGRVVAEIEDYAAILPLIAASVADASDSAVRGDLRELVRAIRDRVATEWRSRAGNDRREPTDDDLAPLIIGVTARELSKQMHCGLGSAHRRVKAAIARELLINNESRRGRRMQLQLGDALAGDRWVFPSVARLRQALGTADLDDEIEVHAEEQEIAAQAYEEHPAGGEGAHQQGNGAAGTGARPF